MITEGMRGRSQALTREVAQDQLNGLDQMLGVGPWGQSMAPQAQPYRDNLQLAANDPQAFNRKLLDFNQQGGMPNPFMGGGGGQRGGSGSQMPRVPTQITSPGKPAGAPSFMQQPQKSRFPNPFS